MSEFSNWQGYKVSNQDNNFVICSPWQIEGIPVFGPDSDYTTMAISLLQFMKNNNIQIEKLSIAMMDIDSKTLSIATGISLTTEIQHWQINCSENAALSISNSNEGKITYPDDLKSVDIERYHKINDAWKKESGIDNVSQGAYVSSQQYSENLNSRLTLLAQSTDQIIWPPRQLICESDTAKDSNITLSNKCTIESWTKLSAAGAPSEFSLRAPILGGLSTVFVKFNEGPKGVFLLIDDESEDPNIGLKGEIVVRRIYGQEGEIRYGTKVRIVED